MDALGALLAVLDTDKWNCNFSSTYFPEHYRRRKMREIVPAHVLQRDDRLAVILGHEKERGVERHRWFAFEKSSETSHLITRVGSAGRSNLDGFKKS